MGHKVLIIDDNYEERSQLYHKLTMKYRPEHTVTPPGFDIELVFAQNPNEVKSLLRNTSFSAVILDVVLKDWTWKPGQPVRASEMLEKMDNDIPVALLSSHWVSDEVKNLVADWPTNNCRMFIHWQDIEDDTRIEAGSITRILFELSKHIEAYKGLDYSILINENEPIRILHLSDLQFGGFGDWKQSLNSGHCANRIRDLWPDGPTFIAITGDIAERGLPEEFDAAYKWLSDFVSEFSWKLPSSRIFVVPGNHDVCLPIAASSHLALKESQKSIRNRKKDAAFPKVLQVDFTSDTELHSELSQLAHYPYNSFCDKVAPRLVLQPPHDNARRIAGQFSYPWIESRFRHLGLIFFGFNTSQPIVPREIPKRTIPLVTVEEIVKEVKSVSVDQPPIVIGLSHHYPLSGQAEWAIDNPRDIDQLFTDIPRISLWLHGHWHMRETTDHSIPGGGRLVINSAPSLSVREGNRPPDTARGFSMVELRRSNQIIYGCRVIPVEWVGTTLKVRSSEAHEYTIGANGYFKSP